jgi:enoyl-CoA hydratase/carnithine racemase
MPDFASILYEERDCVAVVTLNRPASLNAFDTAMQKELHQVWQSLRRNDDVNAVILTGAGERAFCTGIDRFEVLGDGTEEEAAATVDRAMVGFPGATRFMIDSPRFNLGPKSNDLWKPVVAAVNGMAVAGAFYMLAESDILIAAEHATFFDTHTTTHLVSGCETVLMAQRMPLGELLRMQLLGGRERMSAERAYNIGLVSEVVPAAQLMDAAWAVAGPIASLTPAAVQGTLRAAWATRQMPLEQALELSYAFTGLGNTEEGEARGQREFIAKQKHPYRVR